MREVLDTDHIHWQKSNTGSPRLLATSVTGDLILRRLSSDAINWIFGDDLHLTSTPFSFNGAVQRVISVIMRC